MQVSKRIPVRRQTWPPSAIFDFFLLSHFLRNYLTDSNETCLLCLPKGLNVQVQKKKFRSVNKFGRLVPGSDLVKFPIDKLVIPSPSRPSVEFFRSWSECSPQCLVVQVQNGFLLYNWESGFELDSHLLEIWLKGCLTFPDFSCLTLGQNKFRFNRDTHLRVRPIQS